MSETDVKSTYEPLDIPGEARERGGVEILRAGMMSDELFVAARPAFDDPGLWGEVLADITRRISRLYAAERVITATGAKADHRLTATPATIRELAIALANATGAGLRTPSLPPEAARLIEAASTDLRSHPGEAVVLVGEWQPPEVHALAHWINQRLNAPVDYFEPVGPADLPLTLGGLIDDFRGNRVDALIILGANPAYDAPAALDFAGALHGSGALTIHLGPYFDETASLCRWHLPETHPLEDWSDLRATDGTASIAQPLIQPLYDTRSVPWLIGALLGRDDANAYDAVRETWTAQHAGDGFEAWWRGVLQAGVVRDSAAPLVSPASAQLPHVEAASAEASASGDGLDLLLRPDAGVWDGRFANNAWLQECPRPLTRQVWGNAAQIAPEEARRRKLGDGDVVRLALGERAIEASVMIRPGTAPGVVVLPLGYGRRQVGAIGDHVGADGYALRQPDALWAPRGLQLEPTGKNEKLLRDYPERRIEGETQRLFQSLTLDTFTHLAAEPPALSPPPPSLNPDFVTDTYAWAMVIDTSLCIGCNACVVACQSENNIPVVGPEEVAVGRDMHWMRIDTYDPGTEQHPRPGFEPVPCMHCEHAPCEPVCPVAASVHDSEGLNVQVYNRCIGTRFCEANCPYKVRHFNFYGYADGQEYANQGAPVLALQRNPEVTVRARGVMEKCTYCVQRISAARRGAEKDNRAIRDGEVVTACQSACPSRAIRNG